MISFVVANGFDFTWQRVAGGVAFSSVLTLSQVATDMWCFFLLEEQLLILETLSRRDGSVEPRAQGCIHIHILLAQPPLQPWAILQKEEWTSLYVWADSVDSKGLD